jgi:hypothetical protein
MKHLVRISFSSLMMVMMMMAHGSLHAQTKEQPKSTAVDVQRTVILPVGALHFLNSTMNLQGNPAVKAQCVREGVAEVFGFPYPEKLEGVLKEYNASRPMAVEEYLDKMVPGPLFTADSKRDAMAYGETLKSYFIQHPEARWLAPSLVMDWLNTTEGLMKLVDLQIGLGNYVSFANIAAHSGPENIKMD